MKAAADGLESSIVSVSVSTDLEEDGVLAVAKRLYDQDLKCIISAR